MSSLFLLFFLIFPLLTTSDKFEVFLRRCGNKGTGRFNELRVRYMAKLAVGTPPQQINAAFNTGSDLTWIPVKGCSASEKATGICRKNKDVFDPEKSTSFVNETKSFDGANGKVNASGYMFTDQVSYLSASGQSLSSSRKLSIGGVNKYVYGEYPVFGLPSHKFKPSEDIDYELIQHQNSDEIPLNFTYLTLYTSGCNSKGCGNVAKLTFGDLDSEHCEDKIEFGKHDEDSMWSFKTDGLYASGWLNIRSFHVTIDTTSAYISIPPKLLKEYVEGWNARALEEPGAYAVPCSKDLLFGIQVVDSIPRVHNPNIMIPLSPELQQKYGKYMCQIALKASHNNEAVVLGEPFLRSYCIIHDIVNKKIGVAKKRRPDEIEEDNSEMICEEEGKEEDKKDEEKEDYDDDKKQDEEKDEKAPEEDCDEDKKREEEGKKDADNNKNEKKEEEDCDEKEKKKEESKPEEDCDEEEKKKEDDQKKDEDKNKDEKKEEEDCDDDQKNKDKQKNDVKPPEDDCDEDERKENNQKDEEKKEEENKQGDQKDQDDKKNAENLDKDCDEESEENKDKAKEEEDYDEGQKKDDKQEENEGDKENKDDIEDFEEKNYNDNDRRMCRPARGENGQQIGALRG